jgi:hypothetical protein
MAQGSAVGLLILMVVGWERDTFFQSNDVPRDYSGPAAIDRALLEKASGRLATELKGSHVVC